MIEITREPIHPEAIIGKVRKDDYGAIVTFIGTARGTSRGKKVLFLEFDTYQGMAEKKLREIAGEIKNKWHLDDVAVSHRIGRVDIGEIIIVIAVGAPHRKEAFAACKYAIDRIKIDVPIWKKEIGEEGGGWVGAETPVKSVKR